MEESEKRRERLKAMRIEAAQAQVSGSPVASIPPGSLSNPLLNTSISPSAAENSSVVPRFDFYTDPMSAFSGNKRQIMDNVQTSYDYFSPSINSCSSMGQLPMPYSGPRNTNMSPTPTPAHQFQMNFSPDPRIYDATPPNHMSAPWRSPIRMMSPLSAHIGTPSTWNRSGGTPSYGPPPNSSRGSLPSPGYRCAGSPSSNPGRGSYNRFNNSPGSGRSGGRGKGFHASLSAHDQPARFYHKSMVEDPWRFLKPVVKIPDSPGSWLPKSISMKKARVSEPSVEFNSQSSLADCLALSLEEAVSNATNV